MCPDSQEKLKNSSGCRAHWPLRFAPAECVSPSAVLGGRWRIMLYRLKL